MQTTSPTTATATAPAADPLVRPPHPFTRSGMGEGPFRFLGVASIPSPSLAGENPTAYNNALAMLPRDLLNGCGTCAHCGTAIMNIYIVRNAAGERYGVGCDCIEKTADKPLVRASHLAKLKADRERRAAKKQADREAFLAEVNPATGETNAQRIEREAAEYRAAYDAREAARLAARQAIADQVADLADMLEDGHGGFRDSIAQDLKAGALPSGRALEIAADIIAKYSGRRGSQAHQAAYEATIARIEALRA